ncbi:hypothetical protein P5706_34575 [Pseudomonas sp. ChxA]|uniref:oxidoreductase n=1 Tax=Pseudomonas sp. ChxA TaxID=3035473 RepID=UPI0025578DBB|nr:hypothetical protein [Pseudomonas sp. ChxA]MDL2189297.1 hypothetical protein [Pseudomonas sp. ChxA]
MSESEIKDVVKQYGVAARNGMQVGFDGVQVHAANGYLIDQFLRDYSNFRKDQYGGSIDNRIRLLSEVVEEVVAEVGEEQVGVRLSPNGEILGVNDSDPAPLFVRAAQRMSEIGIAYLEVREAPPGDFMLSSNTAQIHPLMKEVFDGLFIMNSDFDFKRGEDCLSTHQADAISYGRPFISNPNLPAMFHKGLSPVPSNPETYYSLGAEGYVDYPAGQGEVPSRE